MEVTAEKVRELREKTGAGMMDCKKALAEAGSMEDAIRFLREKGLAAAAKKAGRTASEGLVAVCAEDHVAAMIEVNCETDFVARNEDFGGLVNGLCKQLVKTEIFDVQDLLSKRYINDNSKTVQDVITDKIATIGEKISIRRLARFQGGSVYGTYVHGGGSIGVMVELKLAQPERAHTDAVKDLARDLAMHIAAASPRCIRREEVDTATLDAERAIYRQQVIDQGKPEAIVQRIVDGKIEKFYTENCLLEQAFVKDPDTSVDKLMKKIGKEIGSEISINRFMRFKVGEGIEKKQDNLADEVAKMVGQ